jgi:hypothetical protein
VCQHHYMSLKRTTVYADADDLALIKEIAAGRAVPEAEIIREGIHLPAMSSRVWDPDQRPQRVDVELKEADVAVGHEVAVSGHATRPTQTKGSQPSRSLVHHSRGRERAWRVSHRKNPGPFRGTARTTSPDLASYDALKGLNTEVCALRCASCGADWLICAGG